MLGNDGLLAGEDAEVVLRLGDPESENIGRGALALPSEGNHADPLLSRRSLGLGVRITGVSDPRRGGGE